MSRIGALHHLELWIDDLPKAEQTWGWLLQRLGYTAGDSWVTGKAWVKADPGLAAILDELRRREPIFHRVELGTTRPDFEAQTAPDFW